MIIEPHVSKPLLWQSITGTVNGIHRDFFSSDYGRSIKTLSSESPHPTLPPLNREHHLHFYGEKSSEDDASERVLPIWKLSDFDFSNLALGDVVDSGLHPVTQDRLDLTPDQEESLCRTGQIDVPSRNFMDQHHTWRVSRGLYSGRDTVMSDYKRGIGVCLDYMLVYFPKDFISSMKYAWINGFVPMFKIIMDSLTRLVVSPLKPKYSNRLVDRLIDEARESFVRTKLEEEAQNDNGTGVGVVPLGIVDKTRAYFAETSIDDFDRLGDEYCGIDDKKVSKEIKGKKEKITGMELLWSILKTDGNWTESGPPTKKELELAHAEFKKQPHGRMSMPEARHVKGVEDARSLQKDTIDDNGTLLPSPRAANEYIKQRNRDNAENTLDQYIQDLIQNMPTHGVAEASKLRVQTMLAALQYDDKETARQIAESKLKDLAAKQPLFSLSTEWKNNHRQRLEQEELKKLNKSVMQRLAKQIRAMNNNDESKDKVPKNDDLQVWARVTELEEEFDLLHMNGLKKRLLSHRKRLVPASFPVLQLDPNKWQRHAQPGCSPRHKIVKVGLDRPWWRLRHAWLLAVQITKTTLGGSYHFMINGPFSLRALFAPHPFYAIQHPEIDHDSYTQTLTSRLTSFWDDLEKQRVSFEGRPDTSLVGKSVERFLLKWRQRFMKVFGSTFIVSFMLVGTLCSLAVTSVFFFGAPILGLSTSLLRFLCDFFVLDTSLSSAYSRSRSNNGATAERLFGNSYEHVSILGFEKFLSPIWKLGLQAPFYLLVGIITPAIGILQTCVWYPIWSTLIFGFASIRAGLRSLRDAISWPFLKRVVRVPATNRDSWLASRIHGPGMAASNEYFTLPVVPAKDAVIAWLDKERLAVHDEFWQDEFTGSEKLYKESVSNFTKYLGVSRMSFTPDLYTEANKCQQEIEKHVKSKFPSFYKHNYDYNQRRTSMNDFWEQCSRVLRAHHPDFGKDRPPQEETSMIYYLNPSFLDETVDPIADGLGKNITARPLPLAKIVGTVAPKLAAWNVKKTKHFRVLSNVISLPKSVRGRFRLANEDLKSLWKFTMFQVEAYRNVIQQELKEMTDESMFVKQMNKEKIGRSALVSLGADKAAEEKNVQNAMLAFTILRDLLGGEEALLETMEDVDKDLILIPVHPEDRHLVFWKIQGEHMHERRDT